MANLIELVAIATRGERFVEPFAELQIEDTEAKLQDLVEFLGSASETQIVSSLTKACRRRSTQLSLEDALSL